MIVPRDRLLFWIMVLVLPFAALGMAVPAAGALSLAMIAGLAILAVVDAMLAVDRLNGVSVELPALVRLTKDREGVLEVHIKNENQRAMPLRFGLAFPREVL